MLLNSGEKVFVITRRTFEGDLRRHFLGEVKESSDFAVRVTGYIFVFDEMSGEFVRRRELRTRIFSLTDAGVIINIFPKSVNIRDITYQVDENNQRVITDGKTFTMNVNEFAIRR